MDIIQQIAGELNIRTQQAKSAVELIDAGNTVPFIARYRKEATGGLSDEVLRHLFDRLAALRRLEEKKQEVIRLISQQGKMTPHLEKKINAAQGVTEVEDLYRPYRPKRRTRATVAKEKGLEPLAEMIWAQNTPDAQLLRQAQAYVDAEKEIASAQEAVQGAQDIVAERISDDAVLRGRLRERIWRSGRVVSKAAGAESTVYDMYKDYAEPVSRLAPHRVLAMNRGEKENVLGIRVEADEADAIGLVVGQVKKPGWNGRYVDDAARDALQRLIYPSIEREVRRALTEAAEEQGNTGVRRQLEEPAAAGAGQGQNGDGARSRIPYGQQGGRGRRHRQGYSKPASST